MTMHFLRPRAFARVALILLIQAAAFPSHAQGLRVAGIEVPQQVTLAGYKLTLNGAGVRKMFGFRVYVASLYLAEPVREASLILQRDIPRRLQVTLLRDTSTEQNLDALREGLIDNNSAADLDAIKDEVARFLALLQQLHDVPAGSEIQLDYLPGKGTHVRIGNHSLGAIPGERFNRALMNIWLGDHPIQLSLKKALLGEDRSAF
jgi:hypothetical protein